MVSKGCVFGKVIKENSNLFVPVAAVGCAEHRGSSEMEPSAQVATLGDFQTKIFQNLCRYFCAVSVCFFFFLLLLLAEVLSPAVLKSQVSGSVTY